MIMTDKSPPYLEPEVIKAKPLSLQITTLQITLQTKKDEKCLQLQTTVYNVLRMNLMSVAHMIGNNQAVKMVS